MVAVFKSRAETLRFVNVLKVVGIKATTIPTPGKRGDMCGISVQFPDASIGIVRKQLAIGRYYNFIGFFN